MLCKQRGKADQKRIIGATSILLREEQRGTGVVSNSIQTAQQNNLYKKNIVLYRFITIIH